MRSPIVRALAICVGIALGSWMAARLIILFLPANRTSLTATVLVLAAAVLAIAGPIIGLFLAISYFGRTLPRPDPPTPQASLVPDPQRRRRRRTLFVAMGIPVGAVLILFFGGMIIPAAWMAGGGDMPPGRGNLSDMQLGRVIFFASIGMAAVGAVLLVASLIAGIGLLLTRRRY